MQVHADVERARPLPARFYRDPELFERTRDVFARSWQWLGPDNTAASRATPVTLLPGLLDEPLLSVRDEAGATRHFPNVCTHRAHPLCADPSDAKSLLCRYHGRRFALDGACLGAPGFEGASDFPDARDDLREFPTREVAGHRFVRLDGDGGPPFVPEAIARRVDLETLRGALHAPARDRDFEVAAHWALYIENYLEGFHVPFVHPSLHRELDPAGYEIEPFDGGVLQVGEAREAGIPPAFYVWWFPNTMWNIYPWGLSVNVVEPLALDRTRVRFRAYVRDPERLETGAGGDLDAVEAEDEAVVERVQLGVRSRNWHGARFSPTQERGVHHFHRLLGQALSYE